MTSKGDWEGIASGVEENLRVSPGSQVKKTLHDVCDDFFLSRFANRLGNVRTAVLEGIDLQQFQ